jgi:hypothetical protein
MSNKYLIIKLSICLLVLLGTGSRLLAQSTDTTRLLAELDKIQQAARKSPVSYDMQITSVRSGKTKQTDSVSGYMKMDGNRLHYLLNGVETIVNERYMIVLYNQDKSMYLAQSPGSANAAAGGQFNMRRLMDNMQDWIMETKGKERVLSIRYVEGATCKSAVFTIDQRTGYVLQTHMVMLVPPESYEEAGDVPQTMVVDSRFFNHTPLSKVYNGFDESIYFIKEGNTIKCTPAYREYQIFKASPNL